MQLIRGYKIKIVTNCTARKAGVVPRVLRARALPKGNLAAVAREWGQRVAAAQDRMPAGKLYQGRAFREATRAARLANTPLTIVSAGLGLVDEEDFVPTYSLTVSKGSPDAISERIKDAPFKPADWWGALRRSIGDSKSFAECVRRAHTTLFVVALSPAYVELLLEDFLALTPRDLRRVRLIGPRHDTHMPDALRAIHLPYDDRLDGAKSPIRGTEADFPQRAAFHFTKMIRGRQFQTSEEHKQLVLNALEKWPRKSTPVRQKLPERDLRIAIREVLYECGGHWSRALRRLRDQRKVACEQKRFKRICGEML